MIYYIVGDATMPHHYVQGTCIIAHICNDLGYWGRGFTGSLDDAGWETAGDMYAHLAERVLGEVQYVPIRWNIMVANMIAQYGIRSKDNPTPIRYDALEACLIDVAATAKSIGATVHMPRIGCGLAGGTWEEVEPIVQRTIVDVGIDVYVYDKKGGH